MHARFQMAGAGYDLYVLGRSRFFIKRGAIITSYTL